MSSERGFLDDLSLSLPHALAERNFPSSLESMPAPLLTLTVSLLCVRWAGLEGCCRCSDKVGGEDNQGGVLCTGDHTPYSAPTGDECKGRGLVLIKTFKTASTTLASYIAQVGAR